MRVICGDLVEGIREKYDIVAANILSQVILDLLKDINSVLKAGGIFICSGIVDKNEKQVVASMRNIGFEILEISSQDEWVAIAGRLKAKSREHRTECGRRNSEGGRLTETKV
jgi:ribosomal protein L11 methyltransferase